MEVIDNYLPEEDFNELKSLIIWNKKFPFFLGQGVAEGEEVGSDFNNWYASNVLYFKGRPTAPIHYKIVNLLNFKVKLLIKLKVNFYPYTEKIYEHKPHVDFDFNCKAALLSLNTCNGFTRFNDGTKVDSVANRLIIFNGHELHNSSTTTNAGGRWNINLNYWEECKSFVTTRRPELSSSAH